LWVAELTQADERHALRHADVSPEALAFRERMGNPTPDHSGSPRAPSTALIECNIGSIESFPAAAFSSPTSPTPPRPGASWAVTPWDAASAGRATGLAVAMLVVAVLVTAATDEGGVAWGERVARVVPLVPVCVAAAAALALAGSRRRMETRALEALGRSPFMNASAAALGAAVVGLLMALLLVVDTHVSVGAFFPSVHASGRYVFEGGGFSNLATGWRVSPDGTIALAPPDAARAVVEDAVHGLPHHARLAASLVTAVASLAFALVIAELPRTRRFRSILSLLATAALTTFCLQAAASGRLPALATPLPSTLLLLGTAWAIVRVRWDPSTR
jgi:hypothetical protein